MATIYCFTSTGNSLHTANTIADRIGAKVLPMNGQPAVCDDDVVGFVFPCYFWGLPRAVEGFITDIRLNKDAYVFAIMTSGGPAFGVFGLLKKPLQSKGIRLRYAARVISVGNYLPEYTVKDDEAQRSKIQARINEVAEAVAQRRVNRVPAFTAINRLAYRLYPKENSDEHFRVAYTCTGCATCQRICPVDNIEMKDGKPVFQHRCEHCLACLHGCPAAAIDWKDKTQGKARYRNAEISLADLMEFNNR